MNKEQILTIGLFLFLVFVIGAVDVAVNLFALIPYIGPAFESVSEVGLELLQFLVTGFGLVVVSQMDGD